MRIFAIPAALLIACCLYLPLPKAAGCFEGMLRFFYAQILRLFKGKNGAADQKSALAVYLLLLCGVCILLGAIHPLAAMILMTPLFTGLASLPACAHTERELDSGKYANDIPSYERIVRESCLSVAPAFVCGVCAPMLLCAVGMPLRMAAPLGYAYAALCALSDQNDQAKRIIQAVQRISDRLLVFFMTLCSGVTGRNPLRVRGNSAEARLLSIVGIAGDGSDTHAPMAGDIAQAIFLCAFSTGLLCFALCAVGFVLCR